jgi:transcription termination factor Rho
MDRSTLAKKSLAELRAIAETLELDGFQRMKKADLVALIIDAGTPPAADTQVAPDDATSDITADSVTADVEVQSADAPVAQEGRQRQRTTESVVARTDTNGRDARRVETSDGEEDVEVREGVLDLLPEGYGFLRVTGYLAGARDVYVSQSVVRRLDLRPGDRVKGPIRRNKNTDKFPALARVDQVEDFTLDQQELPPRRPHFAELTIVSPVERFAFGADGETAESLLFIDTFAPLARGQRGVIVGAPGTGKSTVLSDIADALAREHPDTIVMRLLLDERPEAFRNASEITVGSTCEQPPEDHTQIAELALERAKRLVERGHDVVVLLDSITRLSRAYQATTSANTRNVGGLDLGALTATKRFFAQARAFAEGGSLTVIATATDDSVLDADRLLIDELRQVATVTVQLDRDAAARQSLPAIDPIRSYAHHGAQLRDETDTQRIDQVKRQLHGHLRADAIDVMHAAFRTAATPADALRQLLGHGA